MDTIVSTAQRRAPFIDLIDLANENVGGRVLFATDDFFAPKENLIKTSTPIWVNDKYTEFGKWMDGWESRRKRVVGYDHCIVKLGLPGKISGVNIDTSFFTGNFPEYASIDAIEANGTISEKDLQKAKWENILPKSALAGNTSNLFAIGSEKRWTHLRLNSFPDGGIARLRVHGTVLPSENKLKGLIDVAAAENGAKVITANDTHYGSKDSLILPGKAKVMGEGWETRRRRGPGFDWIIVKLVGACNISEITVDTHHYKGNFPDRCSIELLKSNEDLLPCDFRDRKDLKWKPVLGETKLQADKPHVFKKQLNAKIKNSGATYLKLNIFPDGGVSRLRVKGELV